MSAENIKIVCRGPVIYVPLGLGYGCRAPHCQWQSSFRPEGPGDDHEYCPRGDGEPILQIDEAKP